MGCDTFGDFEKFVDCFFNLQPSVGYRLVEDVLGERAHRNPRILVNQLAMVREEIWRGNVDDEYLDAIFAPG